MDIITGMVGKDILFGRLGKIGHVQQIQRLTHQPKHFVNQNSELNEWKRGGIFLIFLTSPFSQWARPKTTNHN